MATKEERTAPWTDIDTATGRRYLKLPLPEPAALHRLAEGLSVLLAGLRR